MALGAMAIWALGLAAAGTPPPLPSPHAQFAALEGAVRAGDGDALAALAPPDGRVLVELTAPSSVRGVFSPGQFAVVARQLLAGLATTSLEFEIGERQADSPVAFARGRWSWRREGAESSVTLVVTLEWRASAWRLVELRSAP